MSEGNGEFANLDSRMLLYVPGWARRLAIVVLVLLFALSVVLCVYVVFGERELGIEVLLVGLSILQTSAAGIAFVIVLFYSRRDANMSTLVEQSDEFLQKHVRQALQKVSVPALSIERFKVLDGGSKDVFGHLFVMEGGTLRIPVWVGLNVHRLFVIYYVARDPAETDFAARVKDIFAFTFGGAMETGFKANFEPAVVDGEAILSIWLHVRTEHDLLTNPLQKLFWSQDVAMMTESFIRTALRSGLNLTTRCKPAPL
jgi:hypothetical protein